MYQSAILKCFVALLAGKVHDEAAPSLSKWPCRQSELMVTVDDGYDGLLTYL